MKKFFIVAVIALITCLTYTVTAQQAGSVRGSYEVNIPEKIHNPVLDPLPAGTYSIGTGGYFPTIDSAFNKLSIDGIAGEVVLELTDVLYTAPSGSSFILNGPVTGAGPSSRVTIRPADNAVVTINGNGEAVLLFYNVSYLTIDGISPQGSTSLKVHAFYNTQGTSWNDAIDFYGDCDYVQVKNLTASSDDNTRYSTAVFFEYYAAGVPDSCLVSGVFIPSANTGIYLVGDGSVNPTGFVISHNQIGSPTDSLIAWGIQNEIADGTIIENNQIENIRKGNLVSGIYFVYGIQSYMSDNVIIRNNIIHNIAATDVPTRLQGIFISAGGQMGENNWIYNNMVYDIRSYVPTLHWLAGIFVHNNSPKVEYNTVWLSEVNDVPPVSGSSAIYVNSGSVAPIVSNNILINTRNDEPYTAVAARYFVTDISDYNDLYTGPFENSYVGYTGGTFYKTLSEWQVAGKDLNSITEMPDFISASDLHLGSNYLTGIDNGATPVAEILTDFDGDVRNAATPDIGADEFELSPDLRWQWQYSPFPSDVWVMDFSAPSEQVCWAIGAKPGGGPPYGGYSRTTDGGVHWICDTIAPNWDGYLYQVFAMDANTAYIIATVDGGGNSKGIYKTTDGGSNWNRQDAYNTSFYGPGYIHFFDSQNGFVMGDPNNEAYTTTNGGNTWVPVTMPAPLAGEWGCWNTGNGIAAAGDNIWFSTGKRVYKSTDKGYTWSVILEEPQYTLWWPCIKFQDSQIGIYLLKIQGGTDHIYRRTTNGGESWDLISDEVLNSLALGGMSYIPGTGSTYVVSGDMPQGMRGLARTTDGGISWLLIENIGCNFIEFPSEYVGWGSQYDENTIQYYFGPPMPIPVELNSFTAASNGKEIILNWSTTTEVNNHGFEIQRGSIKDNFATIGFVNGSGTTNQPHSYKFVDRDLINGKYFYRLKQVDFSGGYKYSDVVEAEMQVINSFLLEQNYPNPFNPTTTIGYSIQTKSNVKITILNVIGEEVAVILNGEKEAGYYQVEFNAANFPSGVYFYRLKAGEFVQTKKMIFLK